MNAGRQGAGIAARQGARLTTLALTTSLLSCQLMPFFTDLPCEEGETWSQPCGLCEGGVEVVACTGQGLEVVEPCSGNPWDGDDDGVANDECLPARGACCGDLVDCDDHDRDRWPGQADLDGDGFDAAGCGGDDCDDDRADCHPGAEPRCGEAWDHDCDGVVDELRGCERCSPLIPVDLETRRLGSARDLFVTGDGGGELISVATDQGLFVTTSFEGEPFLLLSGVACTAVHQWGQLLVVTTRDEGLRIVDVSEPWLPRLTDAAVDLPRGRGIAISRGLAYVAAESGLFIVDLRDPLAPTLLSGPTPRGAGAPVDAVALSGDHAFVASPGGLIAIDVADPSAPRVVAGLAESPFPPSSAVAVDGDLLYLLATDLEPGLHLIDISTPASPRSISAATDYFGGGRDLFVTRDVVFAAGNNFLYPVDVSSPRSPSVLSFYLNNEDQPSSVRALFVRGNRIYVASDLGIERITLRCLR